jgi:hypothetical protein
LTRNVGSLNDETSQCSGSAPQFGHFGCLASSSRSALARRASSVLQPSLTSTPATSGVPVRARGAWLPPRTVRPGRVAIRRRRVPVRALRLTGGSLVDLREHGHHVAAGDGERVEPDERRDVLTVSHDGHGSVSTLAPVIEWRRVVAVLVKSWQ